jgi:DNA-binding CsgD family transcriptional regulator
MEKIKFTKREKDIIELAKKGYTYKQMAAHHGATYFAINSIVKTLYKKLEVHSMRRMILKIQKMEDETPIFDIAKEEWDKLYVDGAWIMTEKERDFSWEHWLRAWKLAEKRFR